MKPLFHPPQRTSRVPTKAMDSSSPLSSSTPSLPISDSTVVAVFGVEQEDAFLAFVDYARSMLSPDSGDDSGARDLTSPPWSWVVSRILRTCVTYSSGVTPAILLSDLFQAWSEQRRYMMSQKRIEWSNPVKKKHRRKRLPHSTTIDSIHEKNFLSPNSVIEAIIFDVFLLPGTNICMLSLGDMWSSSTIDLYLHRRYYDLVEYQILKKGREVFLTGCCLRTAMEGSGQPRLLPTEYLVLLLDEDKDEDAMLLGAQFCSDSFSLLSFDDVKNGASYSFYARIELVESLESLGETQRKEVTLVDNDGVKLKFLLWGEQIVLANLLSPGNMLALDRPFISHLDQSNMSNQELCLEYGSATRLYVVPVIQQEEQVTLTSTQARSQGSRLCTALDKSQGINVSQVALPLDPQGLVDFRNYPFHLHVTDLHDKMTGVSLYGVVTNISREENTSGAVFFVGIEDKTGAVMAKLYFSKSWSIGRLGNGHTVFISGLTCSTTKDKKLEVYWSEKDSGTLINLSCLPSLLNSPCLHKLCHLSDIFKSKNMTHICHAHIGLVKHVDIVKSHLLCGHVAETRSNGLFICCFCSCTCEGELLDSFLVEVTLADETGQIAAWCMGQVALELLQISPDEFSDLPEDEQIMYLGSLGTERFVVAVINCKSSTIGPSISTNTNDPIFEITRAKKCE